MDVDVNTVVAVTLAIMVAAILLGVHIGFALGITALVGNAILFGNFNTALSSAGSAAYDVLRQYVFATIPLFILMGDFVAKSGAATDLFKLINGLLTRVPGRLAVATVAGNAMFAAVTGVSIASAAAFSRIAYPEMKRYGYKRRFALGAVAGSASLGMLIPPSVLLIIWGVITEQSIGALFLAGVIPGIILALLFITYAIGAAMVNPDIAPDASTMSVGEFTLSEAISGVSILALIFLVLGGIWLGWFSSTEAAGIGALGAMVLAIIKGLRLKGLGRAILDSGKTAAPIMFLLLTAAMYSRFLASGGIIDLIREALTASGFGATGIFLMMIAIWLVLGMLLDSVSIILLTIPIFAPVAQSLGFDPVAFAIFGILVIEAGFLTPPFGLLVYTVKGAVDDKDVTLGEIFIGSTPYWLMMLVVTMLIWAWPELATWLPSSKS